MALIVTVSKFLMEVVDAAIGMGYGTILASIDRKLKVLISVATSLIGLATILKAILP